MQETAWVAGAARYLFGSGGDFEFFKKVFRPAWAARCPDGSEIWPSVDSTPNCQAA